ncbi:MAG: alpha/beta family hydrolase [Hyphomicrobium sp.]
MTKPRKILTIGPLRRTHHLLLAHGAGAPMTSPFLTTLGELLNRAHITVHRFEFPYMREQRLTAHRRPPPPAETLVESYLKVLYFCKDKLPPSARLFIGGKSMGGRVATIVAGIPELKKIIEGLIVVGYPFHPPGKPQRLRTQPLKECLRPALIIQGTRDPFGTKEEVLSYRLPKRIKLFWSEDGNHDLRPRASSGRTPEEALEEVAETVASFMTSQTPCASKNKKNPLPSSSKEKLIL